MSEKEQTAREIESQLWSMANDLRGNMSANEFQNYILGFMFYRYLSNHQEAYMKDQDLFDVEDGQSINSAFLMISSDEITDYLEDIANSLGYAIRPEFTWLP